MSRAIEAAHQCALGAAASVHMLRVADRVFGVLWLAIIAISVHDGYLVLVHRPWMTLVEKNPVGRLLLHWNGGDVWLLVSAKAVGTVCAAAALLVIYWTRRRMGWIACLAIAILQLMLLMFLHFS
jgi:hypothetical protein